MKFAVVALLATVSAQVVCTDDDAADVCVEGCCGYLDTEDDIRACGDGTGSAAVDYDGEATFSCTEEEDDDEEGASKLIPGLFAVVSALYMA